MTLKRSSAAQAAGWKVLGACSGISGALLFLGTLAVFPETPVLPGIFLLVFVGLLGIAFGCFSRAGECLARSDFGED